MPDDTSRPARAREQDHAYMRRALDLARRGWGQTAPNPMVGAVVVRDGQILGEGWHAQFGGDHAEVVALRAAGERARGATLYVSLEPCNHQGKTPPCTDAVLASGLARVVVASRDPHPVAAGGAERLRAAGVAVEIGVEDAAGRELNAPFFHAFASPRPWITLKLALSLDAAIADASRDRGAARRWLTGNAARREVHRLRAGSDAVAVGIGTVLADDPLLSVRDVPAPRVPPCRVVFDSHLRIPLSSALVRTARELPTTVVAQDPDPAREQALRAAGVEVRRSGSLDDALRGLAVGGVRSVLVEGGARLAGALLAGSLVDRLVIFQAPLLLGAGALNAFAFVPEDAAAMLGRLRIVDRQPMGDDLMTIYAFGAA